jgi:hypothetical protein
LVDDSLEFDVLFADIDEGVLAVFADGGDPPGK